VIGGTVSQRHVIVVVGSLHYDIMVDAPDRPRKGETIAGFSWHPKFGGKGGNQAIAAAKAGAEVRMVGAVGDDMFGRFLLDGLAAGGVDASRVARIAGIGSGMSVAISDSGGDYGAVIVSGANGLLDPAATIGKRLWQGARALILQNEIPEAINLAAARAAKEAKAAVCLNAAPYRALSPELTPLIDLLVVNAIEAEEVSGIAVNDLASAAAAAHRLAQAFPSVVVTAGGNGAVGIERGRNSKVLPALPVAVVSTHGAGDVFTGAFVTAFADGQPFHESVQAANAAAAAHITQQSVL